jgi:hypothetical protein
VLCVGCESDGGLCQCYETLAVSDVGEECWKSTGAQDGMERLGGRRR